MEVCVFLLVPLSLFRLRVCSILAPPTESALKVHGLSSGVRARATQGGGVSRL